ncbi:SDR family NAD(P)-dependent oxidoreductase [Mycolicibacterium arenosum]|uniref:SDR family NAD(P)-dependent oxidoreductase n=1 Tax=Mycolicibacterium arenosum TaxID=2952157 RepID=A0ABT1LVW0_9MYCO|nr:SDR family NAD(P)-dependent oxidoreductase [Mycolicibacterium sp. CAU 1645]MCP9271033.1 SDR family NAD(P)-dependent oxidoreductase [Mycolicibacterium sp. CAU 1645]
MTTRTVIVTGANAGLGLECARNLLERDDSWHVVLAVRNPELGTAAIAELGAPERCSVIRVDLASLASVRDFVTAFAAAGLPPLHAVVCNAGLQTTTTKFTADGVEMTFGVNHLGHFELVTGLLDHLAAPGRIVVVASGTHDPQKFTGMPHPDYTSAEDLAYPAADASADGRRRYTTSKLCNVLFAYELDRRLGRGARGITVTAFDPGLMPASGLARDYSPAMRLVWRIIGPMLRVLPNVNTTRTSGRRLAALAVDPAFEGVTGRYYEGVKEIRSSPDSYDEAKAADLWRTSERLVQSSTA